MPSQGELILRLLLAAALAGALGGERELTEQPAGFRTHILVGLGAALFTIISAYGFQAIASLGPQPIVRADVTRVASQIVVGIGFLGGGAILKYGASIRGLTTAASLWVTAAVGTAVGVGELVLGSATAGITLVALVGLRPFRSVLRRYAAGREEFVVQASRAVDVEKLVRAVRDEGARLVEMRIAEEADERTIHLHVSSPSAVSASDVAARLADVEHVRNVDWSA
jgi:putative Mg2+ transporter-C (MgtC) family protein